MLVKSDDDKKVRLSHCLEHQTYESIEEMSKVFGFIHEHCPNISMWFTFGSETPIDLQTIKSE